MSRIRLKRIALEASLLSWILFLLLAILFPSDRQYVPPYRIAMYVVFAFAVILSICATLMYLKSLLKKK